MNTLFAGNPRTIPTSCAYTPIILCYVHSEVLKYVLIPSPLSLLFIPGLPVVFTLYTHHLGRFCRYFIVDDKRRQLTTFDTTGVQAFAVFLDL